MKIQTFTAKQLFDWLTVKDPVVVLDVRNSVDYGRFRIESPYPFEMLNVSYFDFMEIEEESVARIPRGRPIRVVCAKEGSARFVSEILANHGFSDVSYLEGGIKSWGNLLVPRQLYTAPNWTLYQFIRPGKASCSYGLISQGEMALFDPSRNTTFYKTFASDHGCSIRKTFETHLQADYIAGSRILGQDKTTEILAHPDDFAEARFEYTQVEDGEVYTIGPSGPTITAIHTPGHTPGSTCYLLDGTWLISGDTMFLHSVGRPDLGGKVDSWSDMLFDTLQKLMKMDSAIIVLPGHFMEWKEANADLLFAAPLRDVLAYNQSIYNLPDKASFLTFIKNNMRQQPEEYKTIRLVNAGLEDIDDEKAEELDLGKNECAASAYAAAQETTTG